MLRLSVKKKILISGVLVVFLLEVAFGVHVAFQRRYESGLIAQKRKVEEALPVVKIDQPFPEFAQLNRDDRLFESQTEEIADIATIDSRKDLDRTITNVAGDAKKKTNRKVSRKSVKTPIGSESAIAYNAGKADEFKAQTDGNKSVATNLEPPTAISTETGAEPEPSMSEKKSLLAKTASVIKKPFGWIKTLGSKLK